MPLVTWQKPAYLVTSNVLSKGMYCHPKLQIISKNFFPDIISIPSIVKDNQAHKETRNPERELIRTTENINQPTKT